MILFAWKCCSLRINCVAKLILLFGFVLKSSPEHEHILMWICILNFLFLYILVRNEIYALQREKYTAEWYNVILQSSATAAILNLQYKANYRVQWIRDHCRSKRNCFNIMMVLFVLNRWHIKIWNWKTAVKWFPAMKYSFVESQHYACLLEIFSQLWWLIAHGFTLGQHPECWGARGIP